MTTSISIAEILEVRRDHSVAAVELLIPIAHIHPDPFQPRIDCDAELADSIKSQGVLQAISVEPAQALDAVCDHCGNTFIELSALGHYMINDGERRWRGSIAAKQTHILAKVIAPTEEGDRLERQLTANTGKPLTPIEEALAFKRLMEVKGWSQVDLAKHLGRPRATIGDRLRLVDLDPAWLDLIGSGKLQVSHAAIIHKYSAVPTAYQTKAAAALMQDYRAKRFLDAGGAIPVDEFKNLIYVAFRDYIKKLSDVPGYKGPVITIAGSSYDRGESKYAADITLWRPIHRKRENARRKKMSGSTSSGRSAEPRRSQTDIDLDTLAKVVPVVKSSSYYAEAQKGETQVFSQWTGWSADFDPAAFLAVVKPEALKIRAPQGGSSIVVTTDANALEKARAGYLEGLKTRARAACQSVLAQLTDKALRENRISGPGVTQLTTGMKKQSDDAAIIIALAFWLPLEMTPAKHTMDTTFSLAHQPDAEHLLSALAAANALQLKLPTLRSIDNTPRDVRFVLPTRVSKKQQKREARARGDQVGDPSRATAAAA